MYWQLQIKPEKKNFGASTGFKLVAFALPGSAAVSYTLN